MMMTEMKMKRILETEMLIPVTMMKQTVLQQVSVISLMAKMRMGVTQLLRIAVILRMLATMRVKKLVMTGV